MLEPLGYGWLWSHPSIFAFLDQDPDPIPGMTPIHDQITDTGEDTPISFTMPLPEVEAVKDGYIREYYSL